MKDIDVKSKLDARAIAISAISVAPHINGVSLDLSIAESISSTIIGKAELPENGTAFKSRVEIRQFATECLVQLSKSACVTITDDKIKEIEYFIVGDVNLPEFSAS